MVPAWSWCFVLATYNTRCPAAQPGTGGATAAVFVAAVAMLAAPTPGEFAELTCGAALLAILCVCGSSALVATAQGGGGGGGCCCRGMVGAETTAEAPRRDRAWVPRVGRDCDSTSSEVVVVVVLLRCGAAGAERSGSVDAGKTITDAPLATAGEVLLHEAAGDKGAAVAVVVVVVVVAVMG